MKLQIVRIAERGVANKERLHLTALQDTNLAFYTVVLTRYLSATGVANGSVAAFWFPSQNVRAGDQVVLFSGPGKSTSRKEASGSTTYFYYWGQQNIVWADPDNCVVVIEADGWATSPQGG